MVLPFLSIPNNSIITIRSLISLRAKEPNDPQHTVVSSTDSVADPNQDRQLNNNVSILAPSIRQSSSYNKFCWSALT